MKKNLSKYSVNKELLYNPHPNDRQLPLFDMGFWPRFNRCDLPSYPQDDPCTIGYLRLVRQQLLILYRITGKEELHLFSEKFHHYDRISNILKMYRHKFTALKKLNRL